MLKNARMTRKGNRGVNITNGRLIETLIILSEDLVQVVGKVCDNSFLNKLENILLCYFDSS